MVWGWFVTVVIILAFCWWFFHRDPDRYITPLEGWVSPADGNVVKVMDVSAAKTFFPKGKHGFTAMLDEFPDAKYAIVIMLKAYHVHTQRAPNSGSISNTIYRDGKKLNAVYGWEKATVENEHFGLTITGALQSRVYLIAGLIARRIVPMVTHGDKVKQGERIGRIRLGSQVVLILPECDIKVATGDRVYAGLTEVAR